LLSDAIPESFIFKARAGAKGQNSRLAESPYGLSTLVAVVQLALSPTSLRQDAKVMNKIRQNPKVNVLLGNNLHSTLTGRFTNLLLKRVD
jgi:hypothetical protein